MTRGKKIALAAIFAAASLILFIVENLLPPLFIPGAKLGLGNIFVLLAAIVLGAPYGVAVFLVKILLGSLLTGNISSLLYSFPAGALSIGTEITLILLFSDKFSLPSISAVGAIIHNIVQNVVFCLITGTWEYISYLPYLALLGLISGLAVGFGVWVIIKFTPEKLLRV